MRTFTTRAGPSGDPRSSRRIAASAEATALGSSASSLSRDTFARRAPSRSAREAAGVAPSPIAREELQRPTPPRAGFQRAIILDNQPRKNSSPRLRATVANETPRVARGRARPWDRARDGPPAPAGSRTFAKLRVHAATFARLLDVVRDCATAPTTRLASASLFALRTRPPTHPPPRTHAEREKILHRVRQSRRPPPVRY